MLEICAFKNTNDDSIICEVTEKVHAQSTLYTHVYMYSFPFFLLTTSHKVIRMGMPLEMIMVHPLM
jgi:hypothetical protein